jgi:hypothetical protein
MRCKYGILVHDELDYFCNFSEMLRNTVRALKLT